MIPRRWDIQWDSNWWLSLGFHLDHTDPSITLHLPGIVVCAGRCKQPGFKWSMRRGGSEPRVCSYELDDNKHQPTRR